MRRRFGSSHLSIFWPRRFLIASPTNLRDMGDAMKLLRNLLGACLSAALLAACGAGNNGLDSPTPMAFAPHVAAPQSAVASSVPQRLKPLFAPPLASSRFQSLYGFKGSPDGSSPEAALIAVNGELYSTTTTGGTSGNGTVFEVGTSGGERVLYSFEGGSDGVYPEGGLIHMNGEFYGTTANGGTNNDGTVFEVRTSGNESVLYSFAGGKDGAHPPGGVITMNGTLYGTTTFGGKGSCTSGCGTVFEVNRSGAEHVLYRFNGRADGANPQAGLIAVNGRLYGTTGFGGANNVGTLFDVSTSGKESVLYSFKGGKDGVEPTAALVAMNGTLYGTASEGGTMCSSSSGPSGCGIVFAVSASSGTERVLYRFKGGKDGREPRAALIATSGTLYGTTRYGGDLSDCVGVGKGCGTIFEMSTSGEESVLYRFTNTIDGAFPLAGLVAVDGVLYGAANSAGNGCGGYDGCGTIFELIP